PLRATIRVSPSPVNPPHSLCPQFRAVQTRLRADGPPGMGEDAPVGSLPLRTRGAVVAGRAVARLSRLAGAGGGSVIGGRVTLGLDRRALERLAAGRRV